MIQLFLPKLIKSFHYASDGITYTIRSQRNMKIHLAISLLVLLVGMWLHFTYTDTLHILLVISLVMGMEIMNTAIETVVDLVMPNIHPLAKIAKDVAAGSVLLMTLFVIIIGVLIMFPYFSSYYLTGDRSPISLYGLYALISTFLLLVTYIIKAIWTTKSVEHPDQPQILPSIMLLVISIFSIIKSLWIWLFVLLFIWLLFHRMKTGYTVKAFMQNLTISMGGFYALFFLFFK